MPVLACPGPGLVGEVLGEPDGAGAVAVDRDPDVGERAAQDVAPVTVARWLLVEHGLGEADCHLGDGRGWAGHRAALADVLPGGGPVNPGGGLAVTDRRLGRALVGQPAAARPPQVVCR